MPPYYDETLLLDQVAQHVGEHYVDVYSVLKEHAGEEIYYRTDHHWTSLGASYGMTPGRNTPETRPDSIRLRTWSR